MSGIFFLLQIFVYDSIYAFNKCIFLFILKFIIMVLSEKTLKEALAKKFELSNEEVETIAFQFGCTVFNKDIASFAKDEAYYLWLGDFVKQGKKRYFACRIDGLPEEVEADCCDIDEVENFIARNCNMYMLSSDAQGNMLVLPCWHLDVTKVQESARFPASLGCVTGKFEYIGTGGEMFFAWSFYSEKKGFVKAFNIENGTWVSPDEVITHLSLNGKQVVNDVVLVQDRGSIKIKPNK